MNDWVKFFKNNSRNIYAECLKNRRLVQLILNNCSNEAHVLEAGCGTALLSLILADLGYHVTAIDRSIDVLNYARSRMLIAPPVQLNFIEGDLFCLRDYFKMGEFALAFHSGVMEHFADEQIISILSEQRYIARKAIFKVPNIRVQRDLSWFGDERLLSNRHWVRLIRKAGYKRVTVYGDSDLPKYLYFLLPGLFFRFHPAISSWWKWFSGHTIFVCE